jgi:hypothetical protein
VLLLTLQQPQQPQQPLQQRLEGQLEATVQVAVRQLERTRQLGDAAND